jgi:hypothetical protein
MVYDSRMDEDSKDEFVEFRLVVKPANLSEYKMFKHRLRKTGSLLVGGTVISETEKEYIRFELINLILQNGLLRNENEDCIVSN